MRNAHDEYSFISALHKIHRSPGSLRLAFQHRHSTTCHRAQLDSAVDLNRWIFYLILRTIKIIIRAKQIEYKVFKNLSKWYVAINIYMDIYVYENECVWRWWCRLGSYAMHIADADADAVACAFGLLRFILHSIHYYLRFNNKLDN